MADNELEGKARSLANLVPMKKGDPAKPGAGSASISKSVTRIVNAFQEYTEKELENVVRDPKSPTNKVIVATTLLIGRRKGLGGGVSELLDREGGKPDVKISVAETFTSNINISIDPATIALQNYLAEQAAMRRALKVQSTASDIPSLEIAPIAKQEIVNT